MIGKKQHFITQPMSASMDHVSPWCVGVGVNTTILEYSGQIIIFHQPRFPWNKGISLTKLPFGVRSFYFRSSLNFKFLDLLRSFLVNKLLSVGPQFANLRYRMNSMKRVPGNSAGDLSGMVKCPFKRLSDLQLRNQKVTLNHLVSFPFCFL